MTTFQIILLIIGGVFVGVPIYFLILKGIKCIPFIGEFLDEVINSWRNENVIIGKIFWPVSICFIIIMAIIICFIFLIWEGLKKWASFLKWCWQ